ncbi:MAG TPA: putative toxin-antitoxin system toxin component, PIN family [Alloacidobacterium sp.]|nr:putative toxin-antitoxin system toxin component, PIN family [Alloacidobacterium sp.]
MIVVVDSGIWISAIEFGGIPAAALELLLLNDELAICAEIEEEILRVLEQKFGRDPALIRSRLAPTWNQAIRITVTGEAKGICRDPNDEAILECALKSGAQLILSGDKDLLTLGTYKSVRIVTARQYLEASNS